MRVAASAQVRRALGRAILSVASDRSIDVRRQSLGRHLPCSYNDRVVAQLNRMEHANEFGRRRSEIVRYLGALN